MLVKLENASENHWLVKSIFPLFLYPIGIGAGNIDVFLDLGDFFEFELEIPYPMFNRNIMWY